MYLLDTNAISELRKLNKNKANLGFQHWVDGVNVDLFYINSIVLLEQKKWFLSKNAKDPIQGELLRIWLLHLKQVFENKIIPIDDKIAEKCAELHFPNPRPQFDSLIAATALVHDLILVTRNTKDFAGIPDLKIINPFS